ncbi:MAG TPA: sulfur transferase domain-containing protein [Gemmatimonadales bacterium]|nr:sulfur transferase domain-containing protein [Gemmatimonadales bacterium]
MSALLDAVEGILNACEPVAGLVTGGQPELAHLAALKRAGCDVVIDTRDPMEPQPFDAPTAVQAAGLEYVNIPVSHTPLDDHAIEQMRRAVAEAGGSRRFFIYCNSGNRVGAALIPYLMLDRGVGEEDAVTAAMRIGTRQADLLEWALGYVRRSR